MVVYSTLHSGEPFVKFLKPDVPSPKQIEYRKRIRAQGRKHYIVHTGILRFGMSVFVLTTLWSWYEEYGWRVPPRGYLWLLGVGRIIKGHMLRRWLLLGSLRVEAVS